MERWGGLSKWNQGVASEARNGYVVLTSEDTTSTRRQSNAINYKLNSYFCLFNWFHPDCRLQEAGTWLILFIAVSNIMPSIKECHIVICMKYISGHLEDQKYIPRIYLVSVHSSWLTAPQTLEIFLEIRAMGALFVIVFDLCPQFLKSL